MVNSYGLEVWSRPLATPGTKAVALLNLRSTGEPISVTWKDLGFESPAAVRDAWGHVDAGTFASGYTVTVPAHGTALLIVSEQPTASAPAPQPALAGDAVPPAALPAGEEQDQ
jgi:hypothetical protein